MVSGVGVPADADFNAWAADQVMRLNAGLMDGLDRQGLAKAIRGMSEDRKASARSHVRRAMSALLLCDASTGAERATRMAEAVSATQLLASVMTPSLSRELRREAERLYAAALVMASEEFRDRGGDPADLPRRMPWTWEEAFGSWAHTVPW